MEVYSIDRLLLQSKYNHHSKHILINFPGRELFLQFSFVKDFRLRLAQHVSQRNVPFFFGLFLLPLILLIEVGFAPH